MTSLRSLLSGTLMGLLVGAFLMSFARPLSAQLGMATLSGTVTDPSNAVVPGAQVVLASTTEKASRKTVTNSSGQYVIPAIPPGTYQLSVKASGFGERVITDIVLTSGQGSTLDVTLGISAALQAVTVKEAPPLLQTTATAVGVLVTASQFTSLPMLGRNFTTLVAILPGAANVPGPDNEPSGVNGGANMPSVYGQRQRDNDVTVDGAPDLEPNFTRIGMLPPPEATEEMKVETGSDSGAYGWASGANINLVTKSGTNKYHGDAWEYVRNGSLDARSYFIPSVGAFQWNQFGGTFGGPLKIPHLLSKERGWYVFAYYEGIRIHQSANYTALVPTAAQIAGNFTGSPTIYNPYTTVVSGSGGVASRQAFSGNQITSSLLNSTALTLANSLYPLPNYTGASGSNYLNTTPTITTSDEWSGRVDHQFSEKDSLYARYSDWRNPSTSVTLPATPGITYNRFTNVVGSETHIFDPTFLATGRFGMQRTLNNQFSGGPDIAAQTGLVSTFPPYHGFDYLPPLAITGLPTLSQFYGNQGPAYYLSWTGDAHKIKGRHTLSFGGGFVRDSYFADHTVSTGESFGTAQTAFGSGSGSALASFLLGLPSSATRQAGNTGGNLLFHNYSLYAQDTFRQTSKLTWNLGLRWDYIAPPSEAPGFGTFDFNTGNYYWNKVNPVTGAPANIQSGLIPPDYHGFQPRIGAAYALTPKTVVRSSFGIFDEIFGGDQQVFTSGRGNWPFAFQQTLGGLNATTPTAFVLDPFPGLPVASSTPTCCGQEENVQTSSSRQPYVEEWSFSVQRQLTPTMFVEGDYMGSHGVRLEGQILDNQALTPGTNSYTLRQQWPSTPPYIMDGFNEFMSWYDGLSLKLDKRYSRNLTFMVSYTWSKTLDQSDSLGNGGDYSEPDYNATRYNITSFKGPAEMDVRNILNVTYLYDIPGKTGNRFADAVLSKWELSGIASYGSGVPFVVLLSTDNENIGVVSGRISEFPNLYCNPNTGFARGASEWFNTSCYEPLPTYGTIGDAGRHADYSDPIFNWDSALVKKWPFQESRDLEFRAEFFNLLNGSTFDPPNAQVGSATFGKVTTTGRQAGRQIEFALKIHF